jgi:glutaminyl-peptide cyclotransferase
VQSHQKACLPTKFGSNGVMHFNLGLLYGLVFQVVFAFAYTKLSDDSLRGIPEPGGDFNIAFGSLLAPILKPRVSGTPGSTEVLQHFVDFFKDKLPEWRIEFQNSTQTPPAPYDKDTPFVNLILTRDPPWASAGDVSRLALVAHYDSKVTPEGFIGAVDSAAPCAMLMHLARSIDSGLNKKWEEMKAQGAGGDGLEEEKGIQIILLDGEEAFVSWTDTDSTYGARYRESSIGLA